MRLFCIFNKPNWKPVRASTICTGYNSNPAPFLIPGQDWAISPAQGLLCQNKPVSSILYIASSGYSPHNVCIAFISSTAVFAEEASLCWVHVWRLWHCLKLNSGIGRSEYCGTWGQIWHAFSIRISSVIIPPWRSINCCQSKRIASRIGQLGAHWQKGSLKEVCEAEESWSR